MWRIIHFPSPTRSSVPLAEQPELELVVVALTNHRIVAVGGEQRMVHAFRALTRASTRLA